MISKYKCDACGKEVEPDEIIDYHEVEMGEKDSSTLNAIKYFGFNVDLCHKCNEKFGDVITEFRDRLFKEFGCRKIES